MEKPFAPSCERNQQVILDELLKIIKSHHRHLLEIGTGTGQHAVFMAPHFPHLVWHTSDVSANHIGIQMWLDENKTITNIMPPLEFEVGKTAFPDVSADLVLSVNTLHIMSLSFVKQLIKLLGQSLQKNTEILFYGPFNYDNQFTSESNKDFNQWLKEQNKDSGIRNFEDIESQMKRYGMHLVQDISMPANNRLLHFIKKSH